VTDVQVLNFVPEDYIQKKQARKANLLCALLAVVVACALAILFVGLNIAEDSLDDASAEVEQAVTKAGEQVAQWRAFQSERQGLLMRAEKAAQLLVPLPRSRILAEVVRCLPEKTSLVELSVTEETVKVIEASKAQAVNARAAKRGETEVQEHQQTKIRMIGLAPRDIEVAALIAALSNSPYFDQVELPVSEDSKAGDVKLRKFEVLFVLSPDAYRLALGADHGRREKENRL
jgi:Tfp pilus assembly protein PilN